MLELIQDNRSGQRLELVVPTFNEEKRVGNILRYYGDAFDVVLLDDGSSDQTVPMALEAGATVFRRMGKAIGDAHFVHYANEVTRSGLCFYLFADEFIEKSDLVAVYEALRDRYSVVLVSKAEWLYCRRMLTLNHTERRGFRQGCARHDPDSLHENLKTVSLPEDQVCGRLFDLQHLQIWSVRGRFGKAGAYGYIEVEQFRRANRPLWRFCRRYVVSLFGFPFIKAWRERNLNLPRILSWMLIDMSEVIIGGLSWLEQACLSSVEDQLAFYAQFYRGSNPSGEARFS